MYSKYELNSKISSLTASINTVSSKISSLQVPANPNELSVVDTIIVSDNVIPTQQTTIGSNLITCIVNGDDNELDISNLQVHLVNTLSLDEIYLTNTSLLIQDATQTSEILKNMLYFQTPTKTISSGINTFQSGTAGFEAYDLLTNNNTLLTTDTLFLNSVTLGVNNTLDASKWTGNIQTVNTGVNATHYLNFSDAFATGYGKPQKTAGISCNPSTNTVTATTFSGSLSGNSSSASSVSITSDNTAGTYFVPFVKTLASNSTVFVDNASGPLTYNPASSILTSSFFNGAITLQSTQNVATYAGTTLSINGAFFSVNVSFINSSITFTGAANTVNTLSPINMVVGGRFNVGILNSGTGNLVFNTVLGANIKTVYSSNVSIPTLRYACMSIDVITINAVTTYIVNVSLLTN